MIADESRSFEKAMGVGPISLDNIYGYKSINAAGEASSCGSDFKQVANDLLQEAKWNVDPSALPDSLKKAWVSVEFGNFASASKTLVRAEKSKDEAVKSGATLLLDYVKGKMTENLKAAEEAKESGEIWKAYKLYSATEQQFKGYETEVDVKATVKELKSNEAVVGELAAMKKFESAKRSFTSSGMKRTLVKLKGIVEKHPGTEAAAASQEIIDSQ